MFSIQLQLESQFVCVLKRHFAHFEQKSAQIFTSVSSALCRREISSARTAPPHLSPSLCSPPGGLSLWLVLWLVLGKPNPASACPHLCVCYPTPMTVSCQAQNFTAVPVGVPYESQRVFLQNNRITELRVGSFGFGTQVKNRTGLRTRFLLRSARFNLL